MPAIRPFSLFVGGPRNRTNSGTRTVTPRNDRMVVAPECISTAQCMAMVRSGQASKSTPRGRTLMARVPRASPQWRGARDPGAQVARAGARAHRRLGGAHGKDVRRAATPRRGDQAQLVRLAGTARDRVAADGARRDARPRPRGEHAARVRERRRRRSRRGRGDQRRPDGTAAVRGRSCNDRAHAAARARRGLRRPPSCNSKASCSRRSWPTSRTRVP
jgi:hypothetical protein